MGQLIRLVYASRSTFMPSERHQGLDRGVARILAKSRRNNANLQIVGGLLFGDGCFLQCLEGEAHAVETLYTKIESDRRHSDVKVLSRHPIGQLSFGAWSMKYAHGEEALSNVLRAWGMTRFNPYDLSAEKIGAVVDLMRERLDAAHTLSDSLDEALENKSVHPKHDRIVSTLKPSLGVGATWPVAPPEASSIRLYLFGLTVLALVAGTAIYWEFG